MRPCCAKQCDLQRLARAALGIEPALQAARVGVRERVGEGARCGREYSRMRRSSAARDSTSASLRPCLISTLNQLSMPRLMNVEREQVDDEQRRDHQRAEDAHRARREARARHVGAVVAHQLPQLAREQHDERDHPGDVEQQDPRLQAPELARSSARSWPAAETRPGRWHSTAAPARRRPSAGPAAGVAVTPAVTMCTTRLRAPSHRSRTGSPASRTDRCPRRTPARTLML